MNDKPFRLEIESRGTLDNLRLKSTNQRQPGPHEIKARIQCIGLNFRDVLNALGQYPGDPGPLGLECSGTIVEIGNKVTRLKVGENVILKAQSSFSNFVIAHVDFVVKKPDFLSFEAAATIPIAFLTAYYGLHELAKIQSGDRVLIHAAAGGVGIAAVRIAQNAGAEIFGTASTGKWRILQSMGVDHIMNSRNLDFADKVMELTEGQGVDIILNSLAGEFIPKSLSVLARNGRFLEIGKTDIMSEQQASKDRPDVSYFPYDLGEIAYKNPPQFQAIFCELMDQFMQGSLDPLPHKIFHIDKVVDAFRYMAQAKHIGKIVVSLNDVTTDVIKAHQYTLPQSDTVLISGGLGALGLVIANWLADNGQKNLVLMGRTKPNLDTQKSLEKIKEKGARVLVIQADVSRKEDVAHVIETIANSFPPLRGVIHAAGVLDDGILLKQNWQRFLNVLTPKLDGAWNLHLHTNQIPLDFFVLFSSVSSIVGNPGQGNYAAANAYLDAFAHYRRAQGLPAISINWGAWDEVGMAANLDESVRKRRIAGGRELLKPEIGLEILGKLLGTKLNQVGVFRYNWPTYIQNSFKNNCPPFFADLLGEQKPSKEREKGRPDLFEQLERLPVNEHGELFKIHICKIGAKFLGIEAEEIKDSQQSLTSLGLDSLTAIEMKNALELSVGFPLPATLLFDHSSVDLLASYLAERIEESRLAKDVVTAPSSIDQDMDSEVIRL